MGRRRFRLSDMMPNSWFYKLRDMRRRSGSGGQQPSSSCLGARRSTQLPGTPKPVPLLHRASYYYASRDRLLQPSLAPQQPPTVAVATETEDHRQQLVPPQMKSPSSKSYKRRHRVGPVGSGKATTEPTELAPPVDAHHRRRDTCIGRDGAGYVGDQRRRSAAMKAPLSKNAFPGELIASDTDIIFDLAAEDAVPERVLRPIATKPRPAKRGKERYVVGGHAAVTPRTSSASEEQGGSSKVNQSRRSSVSSGRRLKTRTNSPRLMTSRRCRKDKPTTKTPAATAAAPPPLAESYAVVKASDDPRKDFRESMEEMIADKGIRDADDLEDLLACYLVLNAAEHHQVIVEVFEEIWVSLATINP